MGHTRKPLPGARSISVAVSTPNDQSDVSRTLTVMQWGQFVANDISYTPMRKMGKRFLVDKKIIIFGLLYNNVTTHLLNSRFIRVIVRQIILRLQCRQGSQSRAVGQTETPYHLDTYTLIVP